MRETARWQSAKKAARTRAANKAARERFERVDRPALAMIDRLINRLATQEAVNVRWLGDRPLMRGAQFGRLVRSLHGGKIWRVQIEGYKRPQNFYASFWELLL